MKGSEAKMTAFMEGADKRFVIPVYQRKYDWKIENCRQLYMDLKKIVLDGRDSHFFGSIVSSVVPNGSKIEYHIIDGQQRLTTVSLLLLAIRNLIKSGRIHPGEEELDDQILQRFLIARWAAKDDKIKLRLVKSDRAAYAALFGSDVSEYDKSSNLTINYEYFCEMVLRNEIPVEDLFAAIGKLEIICITLDRGDNAQLIFESLNSTGLALAEGDKIRNYILMGLSPQEQDRFYEDYWIKIEKCTADDVSGFVRDYLSIRQQATPNMSNVYRDFKYYVEDSKVTVEDLLADLLLYSKLFEKLLTCRSGLNNQQLDDCLYRLKRLDIMVTRPFFLEVLRLNRDGSITTEDVLNIFLITENYLFRRNICDVPTNALNKIFLNLNREILRYDNTTENYVDKFIYALLSKRENGRFPDDEEFSHALAVKQVYQMRGKYKAYLFERFENYQTLETKDVYSHLDNNVYTIEHIMPQHLTPEWKESLGDDYEEIHATWLHRLANLTLTGYNLKLSNNTFMEKRDDEEGGYRASGLRMNQKIASKDSWGLPELEERSEEMVSRAKTIWSYPETDFVPVQKELDSCTLDDEDVNLTGRDIARFSYLKLDMPVTSWADMYGNMIKFLHQQDKSVLNGLIYGNGSDSELGRYVSSKESDLRSPLKIDDQVYIEKNTGTSSKISVLRRLFAMYGANPEDLVFYLRDADSAKMAESDRNELRRRYWTYALPIIRAQHVSRGAFCNVNPGTSNSVYGSTGIPNFSVGCSAGFDRARVDLYLHKNDPAQNKRAFDILYSHRDEIEQALGISLIWTRADENISSWIACYLFDVSINNEDDWPLMAKFQAEYSDRFCNVMIPYLMDVDDGSDDSNFQRTAAISREWAMNKDGVNINLSKCSRTYTRFTTPGMSKILPDIKRAMSGWNTENHYFYEIQNKNGRYITVNFVISSQNATDEFISICDRINEIYPAKSSDESWKWRTNFRSRKVPVDESQSKGEIMTGLDQCYEEIMEFEADLRQKL